MVPACHPHRRFAERCPVVAQVFEAAHRLLSQGADEPGARAPGGGAAARGGKRKLSPRRNQPAVSTLHVLSGIYKP